MVIEGSYFEGLGSNLTVTIDLNNFDCSKFKSVPKIAHN
jgi:hypothetical protein